MKSMINC